MKLETFIPFAGFYETIYGELIDSEMEREILRVEEDYPILNDYLAPWQLFEKLEEFTDYNKTKQNIAEAYVQGLEGKFNEILDQLNIRERLKFEFKEVISPREYNFTTDRILIEIDDWAATLIYTIADKDTLKEVAKRRHTSRSGFHSFYDLDYTSWGNVLTWDANQLETLLIAFAEQEFEENWELWILEDYLSQTDILDADWIAWEKYLEDKEDAYQHLESQMNNFLDLHGE